MEPLIPSSMALLYKFVLYQTWANTSYIFTRDGGQARKIPRDTDNYQRPFMIESAIAVLMLWLQTNKSFFSLFNEIKYKNFEKLQF